MAKLAQSFAKYMICAKMRSKGIVERPDVIGAIFGQTEGLLGADLDLRELQRTGRVGRIEVNVKNSKGTSYVEIIIPSSLDSSETALIASALETIDKVGPCEAQIEISKVEDVRSQKRRYVIDRAKEILRAMMEEGMPDSQKISELVKESVRAWEVSDFYGLSCGPNIEQYDEIIIVEGRADVINLLKNGIRNVIAIEGSKIPEPVINLTKEKTTTAFLDGDRGGDLDLKKLLAVADIDFIARAESGEEVEDLSKKQIFKALRERTQVENATEKIHEKEALDEEPESDVEMLEFFKDKLNDLIGTHAAYIIDGNDRVVSKAPISELSVIMDDFRGVKAIVLDGKINQDIVDAAAAKKIKYLIGIDYKERVRAPAGMKILTAKDFENDS